MIAKLLTAGVELGFSTAVRRIQNAFLAKSVAEFFTDKVIDVEDMDDEKIVKDYLDYRSRTVKDESSNTVETIKTAPDELQNSLAQTCDITLDTLQNQVDNITLPEIETVTPEQKTTTASDNDSLISVMIKNNDSLLEAMHEQTKVNESIQHSLKSIAESMKVKSEIEKSKVSQQVVANNMTQHELELLSSTLPAIAHSLSHLPLMLQSMDIMAQSSVTNAKFQSYQNYHLYRDANEAEKQTTHLKTQADELTIQTTHLEKTADLAHFELNHEVTDSSGYKTTPAKAKADSAVEERLSQKLENSITADDLDLDGSDINIFNEVVKIMGGNDNENNTNS